MLVFSACTSTNITPAEFEEVRFRDAPRIALDVAAIQIKDRYEPPFSPPNVEHLFPTPPARSINNWVNDRLVAMGNSALLEVEILDASVSESGLQVTEGFMGLFQNEQAERYDGHLAVSMKIYDGQALPSARITAEVSRSITTPENMTVESREALFYQLNRQMMQQLDEELEKRIRQYFGKYLL